MRRNRLLSAVAVCALLAGCDDPPDESKNNLPPVPVSQEAALLRPAPEPEPPPPEPAPGRLVTLPRSLDFGTVIVGSQSAEALVTVQNAGEKPVIISAIRSEMSDNIAVRADCPPILEKGASCRVAVWLRAIRPGVVQGRVSIDNDGEVRSSLVSVGGLVQALPPEEPAPEPEPEPVPDMSEEEKLRRSVLASRLAASVRRDGSGPMQPASANIEVEGKNEDPDWGKIGLDKSKQMFTYPVNRCRVITEDQNINAVLEDTVHTELGGRVVAIVERNIYGKNCRNVLIPKGSSVVGYMEPVKDASVERVAVNWQRIITPKGQSIIFDALVADPAGKPGLPGDVDRRLLDKYGTAFLISGLSALLAYATPADNTNVAAAQADFAANSAEITARDVAGATNIMPVITVPKRGRILIIPTQDLWFPEPRGVKKEG